MNKLIGFIDVTLIKCEGVFNFYRGGERERVCVCSKQWEEEQICVCDYA